MSIKIMSSWAVKPLNRLNYFLNIVRSFLLTRFNRSLWMNRSAMFLKALEVAKNTWHFEAEKNLRSGFSQGLCLEESVPADSLQHQLRRGRVRHGSQRWEDPRECLGHDPGEAAERLRGDTRAARFQRQAQDSWLLRTTSRTFSRSSLRRKVGLQSTTCNIRRPKILQGAAEEATWNQHRLGERKVIGDHGPLLTDKEHPELSIVIMFDEGYFWQPDTVTPSKGGSPVLERGVHSKVSYNADYTVADDKDMNHP